MRMISVGNNWVEKGNVKTCIVEYKKMDFYGPFLTFSLEKSKEGSIAVTPVSCITENPQEYEGDYKTLITATQELYKEIGKYTLRTKLFEARINSVETEKIILQKLKELSLF